MKKIIFFIIIFSWSIQTEGQIVFCPTGAEWNYSFKVNFPYYCYNVKIKYIKDSIVNGETLKVLSHGAYYRYCTNGPPSALTFIKQQGDTVFMKNAATQNSWQILYNYAATAGQSWISTISSFYNFSVTVTYTITVDSVKTITVNNFVLRQLFVKFKNSNNPSITSTTTQIIERFGVEGYMFNYDNPIKASDCDGVRYFLCYRDDEFGLTQFTDKPCDYVDYVGLAENYQEANIKIYPNPANDIFTISSEDELINSDSFVSIKDLTGREIKQVAINNLDSDPGRIDIADLAKGVYILNLSNNNELVYTGKLIKSE